MNRIERLPDWRTRLDAYLAECEPLPFLYGFNDCATFAFGAVREMTGVDVVADVRGGYTTDVGALRKIRKLGHADLVSFAGAYLPPTDRGREGDVAVMDGPEGHALGIFGRGVVHGVRPDKGLCVSYDEPVAAFAVPYP